MLYVADKILYVHYATSMLIFKSIHNVAKKSFEFIWHFICQISTLTCNVVSRGIQMFYFGPIVYTYFKRSTSKSHNARTKSYQLHRAHHCTVGNFLQNLILRYLCDIFLPFGNRQFNFCKLCLSLLA